MLIHPQFDPVAIHLGPLAVRWYGLMYLVGFGLAWAAGRYAIRTRPHAGWRAEELDDVLFYGMLGVIMGGRLGYVLFYKLGDYLSTPWHIFYVWEGGMSFHGGLLGVLVTLAWYAHQRHRGWFELTDFVAPLVPLGLGAGRLGNFINAELWGRVTDVPWAVVFPNVDGRPRHASQLYEFALEGVLLFIALWWYAARPRPRAAVSGAFLLGYGALRFGVEFTREPDSYLGLLAFNWSMGQWLSLPMVVAGIALLVWAYRKRPPA